MPSASTRHTLREQRLNVGSSLSPTSDVVATHVNAQHRRSRFKLRRISYGSIWAILAISEFTTLVATSVSTGFVYHLLTHRTSGLLHDYVAVGILVAILYCAGLNMRGFYAPTGILNKCVSLSELLPLWTGIFAVLAIIAFTGKLGSHFSRGAEISFYLLGLPAAIAIRRIVTRAVAKLVRSGTLTGPRVAVLFESEEVEDGAVLNDLRRYGFLVLRGFPVSNPDGYAQAVDDLLACARTTPPDEVLILANWSRLPKVDQVLARLRRIAAPVRLLADRKMRAGLKNTICHVGPMLAVELRRAPLTRCDQVLKRSLDVLLAGIALVVLAPLLISIALLVKLDSPGPIFFKQKRIGFNGQTFSIFKFRTMSVLENGPFITQAVADDPRVTQVGRWLRRSSLDELPQLFNVLRGEMSVVGPRPHAEVHDNAFDVALSHYAWRHNVKPGMTGWAQVNGSRGEVPDTESVRRRVDYDLWYIENWTLWLDLQILARTVPVLFAGRNAY